MFRFYLPTLIFFVSLSRSNIYVFLFVSGFKILICVVRLFFCPVLQSCITIDLFFCFAWQGREGEKEAEEPAVVVVQPISAALKSKVRYCSCLIKRPKRFPNKKFKRRWKARLDLIYAYWANLLETFYP